MKRLYIEPAILVEHIDFSTNVLAGSPPDDPTPTPEYEIGNGSETEKLFGPIKEVIDDGENDETLGTF